MAVEQDRELVLRFVEEAYNQGRVKVADELLAPMALYRGPLTFAEGRENIKAWLAEWLKAFPDLKISVERCMADVSGVALRVILRGTQRGPFRTVDPSRRRLVLHAVFLFTVAAGQITDIEAFYDTRTLQEELGDAVPARLRYKHFERSPRAAAAVSRPDDPQS